jgi:hypothetical protein
MTPRVHAVPTAGEPDEPIDPYDPESLRYDAAEFLAGQVHSAKVTSSIKVRKPGGQEWFRLHPSQEFQLPTALFLRQNDDLIKPETYLVMPACRHLFGKSLTPVRLRLAVNSLDTVFLWDMKVPKDGIMSDYYISLQEAADEAERSWVKLEWNNGNRSYDHHYALDDLGDPQFLPADRTMRDWLKLGFKGREIDREDHPVVAEYRGKRI